LAKTVSSYELTLGARPQHQTRTRWLYDELRHAILEKRLAPGTKLPASRDFGRLYGLARGTVVSVFERLQAEGYVSCRVGSGTRVNQVAAVSPARAGRSTAAAYIRRVISSYARPKPWVGIEKIAKEGVHPFSMREPAMAEFPAKLWGSLAARRARKFTSWLRTEDDGRGYRPLREAITHYLASSRGVRSSPDHIVIVSGVQQALDLLSRMLLKRDDPVWMEDPGYFGASIAFESVGARIVPVPVDTEGLSVSAGLRMCPQEVLKWASSAGAFVIEDDYDSEYRFEGQPVPAMQTLDGNSNVIFIGSFSKILFPSLRLGYVVLPPQLADYFLAFRSRTDFRSVNLDQAVLCDFIVEGHLGRHLRRMRNLYASRLEALIAGGERYLKGRLKISGVRAGLYTVGFLENGMNSRQGETAAAARGVEVFALDRYTLKRPDQKGLLLGFAAFDETAIRKGLIQLAAALDQNASGAVKNVRQLTSVL